MRCWLRIGAFALSGNHALAIEEICSLALSVFFKKPINFGNDCLRCLSQHLSWLREREGKRVCRTALEAQLSAQLGALE
jgi:hypothetical protein